MTTIFTVVDPDWDQQRPAEKPEITSEDQVDEEVESPPAAKTKSSSLGRSIYGVTIATAKLGVACAASGLVLYAGLSILREGFIFASSVLKA